MCQWNELPNVVLLEGGRVWGEEALKNWRQNDLTDRPTSKWMHVQGQEESTPLGCVDGWPQTSIVFIWTLTQMCLISLCYHCTVKSELSGYSAHRVHWVWGPGWMWHVGCGCLSYLAVAFLQNKFSRKTCKLWSRQDYDMCSVQPGRIDRMKVNGVSFNTFLHFLIRTEKELITPPLNGLILPGVTRKSLLELAKSWVSYSLHEISYYFLNSSC